MNELFRIKPCDEPEPNWKIQEPLRDARELAGVAEYVSNWWDRVRGWFGLCPTYARLWRRIARTPDSYIIFLIVWGPATARFPYRLDVYHGVNMRIFDRRFFENTKGLPIRGQFWTVKAKKAANEIKCREENAPVFYIKQRDGK